MILLGSHIPTVGGVSRALERAVDIGCTAMQIFVKNNMQWFAKPLPNEETAAFLNHPLHQKIHSINAHAGYLINLSVQGSENHQKSLQSLSEELARCDQLKIPYLVLHPGSHLNTGVDQGIASIVKNLNTIHRKLPHLKTRIALETTAGQGTCIGSRFEEIAMIMEAVEAPDRLRVCLDTAHVFAAGYDIAQDPEKVFSLFDKVIGLDQLCILHINDSKVSLGSHVDRHEKLGKGKIGIDAFRWLMNSKKLASIPKILETPKGKDLAEDVTAMKLLRSFIGR